MANSKIGQFFLGTPSAIQQVSPYSSEQQQALSQVLQMALSGMQNPTQGFAPIAQQARTQFQQQTVPSLAERFTSLGGGAQSSSGFAQSLGQAGAGLEENLASLQSQYGLQNQQNLQNLLRLGLQPQFENFPVGGQPGALEQLGRPLGQFTGNALTGGLGGLWQLLLSLLGRK